MKKYLVQIEVAGPVAMFARPDTGGTPTSYAVPTWSASKGIFEAIAFLNGGDAWFCPTKVATCKPVGGSGGDIRFQRMTMNYGGPLRKKDLFNKGIVSGGSSMQLSATVLVDVCYRIEAEIRGVRKPEFNPRHYLQHLFERRLKQGRCWRTPCLGWSEFVCSYWGPYRTTSVIDENGKSIENKMWRKYCDNLDTDFGNVTEVDKQLDLEIPSMLSSMWSNSVNGNCAPAFVQDVEIRSGVLSYANSSLEASNA